MTDDVRRWASAVRFSLFWDLLLLGAIVAAAACVSGCTNTWNVGAETANGLRELGHETAPILKDMCVTPAQAAANLSEPERLKVSKNLEDMGCPELAKAYKAVRLTHVTLHAIVVAGRAGECQGVSPGARHCNVVGAIATGAAAASEVSTALQKMKGAKK